MCESWLQMMIANPTIGVSGTYGKELALLSARLPNLYNWEAVRAAGALRSLAELKDPDEVRGLQKKRREPLGLGIAPLARIVREGGVSDPPGYRHRSH